MGQGVEGARGEVSNAEQKRIEQEFDEEIKKGRNKTNQSRSEEERSETG